MKVQELIELINNAEDLYSLWDAEEIIPSHIKLVEDELNPDRHRWYCVSTNVYKCEDGFVGVRGVSQLFSEMMSYSDCDEVCYALEYEEVTTITYKPKPKN